jgi:hypothetical protein
VKRVWRIAETCMNIGFASLIEWQLKNERKRIIRNLDVNYLRPETRKFHHKASPHLSTSHRLKPK